MMSRNNRVEGRRLKPIEESNGLKTGDSGGRLIESGLVNEANSAIDDCHCRKTVVEKERRERSDGEAGEFETKDPNLVR